MEGGEKVTFEERFRKDIIEGFALIIPQWCRSCERDICTTECLRFKAASRGHLNIIKEWKEKGE